MDAVYFDITIDMQLPDVIQKVGVKQYADKIPHLRVTINDGGIPYTIASGTSAKLQGTRGDGSGFMLDGTIQGNVIEVELTKNLLNVKGPAISEIVLTGTAGVMPTPSFWIDILTAALQGETVEKSDAYQSIEEIKVITEQYKNAAETARNQAQTYANNANVSAQTAQEQAAIASNAASDAEQSKNDAQTILNNVTSMQVDVNQKYNSVRQIADEVEETKDEIEQIINEETADLMQELVDAVQQYYEQAADLMEGLTWQVDGGTPASVDYLTVDGGSPNTTESNVVDCGTPFSL